MVLPHVLGLFLSEVLTIVGLYVLLGLGLNIVVGYAGLLDLGYVAFFAIGSYMTAILTSPELGFFSLNFWQALPFAILFGILSGVLLGVPVLKMRGDYLAIATLGFGEIIRILVLSDFLRPWLGGAQGIGKIPKAAIGGYRVRNAPADLLPDSGRMLSGRSSFPAAERFTHRPRLDGRARGRGRGPGHGDQSGGHQAAGLCHRCRLFGVERRHLCHASSARSILTAST